MESLPMEKIRVSSADALTLDDRLMKNRSLIKILNNKGPSTDPCTVVFL